MAEASDAAVAAQVIADWRARTARWFADADIIPGNGEVFVAQQVRGVAWEDLRALQVQVDAHVVRRTEDHLRTSPSADFVLALQVEGASVIAQDGREVELGARQAAFYDTSRPYTLTFDGPASCIGVRVTTALIPLGTPVLAEMTARRLPDDSATNFALAAVVRTVSMYAGLDAPVREYAARALESVFMIACLNHAQYLGLVEESADADRTRTILRYVKDHLTDPNLSAATIAQAHFMSVRNVHRLAASRGIRLGSYIRKQRLERCREALHDSALHAVPVAAIGASWGFPNAAHFSTAFGEEFGMSPSEYRRHFDGGRRPPNPDDPTTS